MTSIGFQDVFIAKLNGDGDLVWVKQIGGVNRDWVYDLALDSSGNVYIVGSFEDTVDFDPGAGIYNLTSNAEYYEDTFVLKLNDHGNFLWAKNMGGADSEGSRSRVARLFCSGVFFNCPGK